jgi:indole-3-glycerol phosphate synthase
VRALREKSAQVIAIIAEVKRASPSKGTIREALDPAALARELEAGGAACLSVLTEEKWFLGSLANLRAASAATQIPCLRKDFTVDEFQILEARANCADAVLLIAAALDDATLLHLAQAAHARDLDVLCEVHTAAEMDRVLPMLAGLDANRTAVGVNSRNLHSFAVSLEDAAALANRFITGRPTTDAFLLVAESGITCAADLATLQASGYSGFLIGESLMRAPRPGTFLRELLQIPPCG